MTWTLFWDMHSGGGTKEPPYDKLYIEAPEDEAKVIFYNRFGHNPERVSCTCCGEDYSISENESFAQLSGFHRGCKYDSDRHEYVEDPDGRWSHRPYVTVDEYKAEPNVLVIPEYEIADSERIGEVPTEGWVWA